MNEQKNALKKLLLFRLKNFKDSNQKKVKFITFKWFNKVFVDVLKKERDFVTCTCFDKTNNTIAYSFKFNLNNFAEAEKFIDDIITFIKPEHYKIIINNLLKCL